MGEAGRTPGFYLPEPAIRHHIFQRELWRKTSLNMMPKAKIYGISGLFYLFSECEECVVVLVGNQTDTMHVSDMAEYNLLT